MNTPMERANFSRRAAVWTALLLGWPAAAAAGVNEWTSTGPGQTINIVVPGVAENRLYAGSVDGLYRSDNDAGTWERLTDSLTGHIVLSVVTAASESGDERLYAGTHLGLYLSANGGATWTRAADPGGGIMSLATSPSPTIAEAVVYAGTFGRGVYVSRNGGVTWSRSNDLVDAQVYTLEAAALDAATVYAGTADGLYVSRDSGESWSAVGTALQGLSVRAVYLSSVDPNHLVVGTYGDGVLRSFDGGSSWATASIGLNPPQVRSLAADEANPDVMFAATSTGGFFRTKDGGTNWLPINFGLPSLTSRFVMIDPDDRDRLLGSGTGDGVYEIHFAPEPQIVTLPTTFDFGPVPVSSRVTQTLQIGNTGTADLVIADVRLGGSSGFSLDFTGSFVVPAGGSHFLTVSFEPKVRDIILRDEIRISSNDPDEFELAVSVTGRGTRSVLSASPSRVDFGRVTIPPGFRDTTITLTNTGSAALQLFGAHFDNSRFSIQSFEPVVLQPGQSTTVRIAFNPLLPRPESGNLLLISDSTPDTLKLTVTGVGTAPDIFVSSVLLDYGRVSVGDSRTLPLVVRNIGTADLTITRLLAGTEQFFVDRTLGVPRDTSFVVPGMDTILVVTGSDTTVTVGTGSRTTVQVGRDTTRLISLGDTSVVVTSGDTTVVIVGSERTVFLATEDSTILAPDGSFTFQITYRPTATGAVRDTLEINSDAPIGFGLLHVVLRGEGNALSLDPSAPIPVGEHPVDMVTATLDGISGVDLAIVDSVGGRVHVMLNDGAGTFPDAGRRVYPNDGSAYGSWAQPIAVAAAPIFGMTAMDLIIGDRVARSVSLLANDGTGRFDGRREDIFIGHQLSDVVAVDLDADGDVDIAVANGPNTDTITLLYNDGQGSMSARAVLPVQTGPVALAAGHFDADGYVDLVVANRFSNSLTILINDRNGTFFIGGHHAVGISPLDVAVFDMDADGDLDIAASTAGSRSISLMRNDGLGSFQAAAAPQSTNLRPVAVAADGMTADILNDLVVGGRGDFLVFFENVDGTLFERQDVDTGFPIRDVHLVDLDDNRVSDLIVLSADSARVRVYHNRLVGRKVPPRPPALVTATDVRRDLGGSIVITWEDGDYGTRLPEEQVIATTGYTVVRATDVDFENADTLGSVPGGVLSFTDESATPYETFYYQVTASRGDLVSAPSSLTSAVSLPAPLFDLKLTNAPRVSRGDTLRAQIYLTPAGYRVAGASVFLTYEPSALRLLAMPADSTKPFRVSADVLGGFTPAINAFHNGVTTSGKLDLSLISTTPGGGALSSGVEPVLIAELWFQASQQVTTFLAIDDEPAANRSTAIVEDTTGTWIEPVLGDTTRLTVRDVFVSGRVAPQRRSLTALVTDQATLLFIDTLGDTLVSSLNDADRLAPGIQVPLDATGRFFLDQIPTGTYRVFAKVATHLQGSVFGDTVSIDSTRRHLTFRWVAPDTTSLDSLPAGDANDDNLINLADFGVLVRHFGDTPASPDWSAGRKADFDGDSQVGFDDFLLLADNFGRIGMQVSVAARPAAASPGAVSLERQNTAPDALRGRDLGAVRGLTLVLPDGASADAEASVFTGADYEMLSWPDADGRRVAIAITGDHPVSGDGVLLRLQGLMEDDLSAVLGGVEILDVDGRSIRPGADTAIPMASVLHPNYPNPFNPSTTIPFDVAGTLPVSVRLEVFDVLGQRIRTLLDDGQLRPGRYRATWDARDEGGAPVASGMYLARLTAAATQQTHRLLLVR